MSFNFQGPSEMPIIRGAQNMMNNGGGGNLGYFQGRQKKKEEESKSLFSTDEEDSFTLSEGNADVDSNESAPAGESITNKLKGFFKKFTGNPDEKNP